VGKALSLTLTHYVILVILHDFTGDDEAQCVYNVLETGNESLTLTVISDGGAFGLSDCQTKGTNTNILFKLTGRLVSLEQLVVLSGILTISLTIINVLVLLFPISLLLAQKIGLYLHPFQELLVWIVQSCI
jgi:hypothetical protein